MVVKIVKIFSNEPVINYGYKKKKRKIIQVILLPLLSDMTLVDNVQRQ